MEVNIFFIFYYYFIKNRKHFKRQMCTRKKMISSRFFAIIELNDECVQTAMQKIKYDFNYSKKCEL